jgi:hypothetical protein
LRRKSFPQRRKGAKEGRKGAGCGRALNAFLASSFAPLREILYEIELLPEKEQ